MCKLIFYETELTSFDNLLPWCFIGKRKQDFYIKLRSQLPSSKQTFQMTRFSRHTVESIQYIKHNNSTIDSEYSRTYACVVVCCDRVGNTAQTNQISSSTVYLFLPWAGCTLTGLL